MKKKLKLPNVSLLAIAHEKDVDQTQVSMKISSENIEFGAIKLLTSAQPKIKYPDIEYIPIKPMNLEEFNKTMIEDLHKYFQTTHCLFVQADSFVVNYKLWKDEFLKYDYIGAPWSDKLVINQNLVLNVKKNPVGNGGFSLRSHKLLLTTSKIDYDSLKFPLKSEDVVVCHYLYDKMIEEGVNFAPPKLAAKFSIENVDNLYGQNLDSVFGFHGKHLRNHFLKKYVLSRVVKED
tara:strand:- start:138 stop:839 length:702 start_codon:yes stop_codon:yes gene_type:complete